MGTAPTPPAGVVEEVVVPKTDVYGPSGRGKVAYVQRGDLWIRPLPEGDAVQLTDDGLNSHPLWSPSGRYLAFRKDVELMTVDTASGVVRSWATPVSAYLWSPAGDLLAYVAGSGILRLAVVDMAAGTEVTLIPPEVGVLGRIGDIAWSPDGQAIVYEWYEGQEAQGLFLIPYGGGEATELYERQAREGRCPAGRMVRRRTLSALLAGVHRICLAVGGWRSAVRSARRWGGAGGRRR